MYHHDTLTVPLKACWLNHTEMSCCFSHLSALTDRGEIKEPLTPRFLTTSSSGDTGSAVSSRPKSAEMPKGCLFLGLILNKAVSQRYLAKLTREGSYSIGGFHCLPKKDRNTWGCDYTVHVHYIHIQTVVREVNKGDRCVHLQ